MNRFLVVMFLSLLVSRLHAQSDTYKIENITKPEKLLPTVTPGNLYGKVEKDFLQLSVTENLVDLGTHPVITGYLNAYQNHYPLTISPDIAWLLICQGFANHVSADPDKIRSKLVDFEGKKTLVVKRDLRDEKSLADFKWQTVFPEFAAQIAGFTGKELIDNLSADFSTTTPTVLVASQITIMESMKEFFNYKVKVMGCGISEVTVEGTVKDWEKIYSRLDYLAKYDLEWWTSELKPIIQKIIDTKKGNLDKQFWMNMVKYHELGVYGSYDGIDGWLLKFYPYLKSNGPPQAKNTVLANSGPKDSFLANNAEDVVVVARPLQNRTIYLQRSTFKEIKSIAVLPNELVNVPFILEITDPDEKINRSFNMEFWAGFMGVKQNPETFNVKPEIGWAVNRKGEVL